MYRNYRRNMCYCNDYCDKKDDVIEDLCENVANVMEAKDMCECGFDEDDDVFPMNPMYGQSYVPWQTMGKTFTPEAGLNMGTIYPELVRPYRPCQSMEEINYLRESNKIREGCNKC